MTWKAIRVDFTPKIKCQFCTQYITSGKGVLVKNEKEEYAFSGPCCAKKSKNVINPTEKLVDVTKATFEQINKIHKNPSHTLPNIKDTTGAEKLDNFPEDMAKSYLVLRCEKLAHIERISKFTSNKLNDIYQKFKISGNISKSHETYLNTIMFGKKFPTFTYQNLQAIYAADYWLSYFINNSKTIDVSFAESLLEQLGRKLTLTVKQIEGINKWFDNAEEKMLKIKTNAFVYNE